MTQRVELATVMDRLAVDGLITDYAVAVDDGDWSAYRELFTSDGRADYRSAGGIEGDAVNVASWLAESMGVFAMRQHLIVNRRVRFGILDQDTGDTAQVQADYVNPMRLATTGDGDGSPAARPISSAAAGTPSVCCGRTTAGGCVTWSYGRSGGGCRVSRNSPCRRSSAARTLEEPTG